MAGTDFGSYASQVVTLSKRVVALPEQLTFEQGAAVNYSTPWAALIVYSNLQVGERVLIQTTSEK